MKLGRPRPATLQRGARALRLLGSGALVFGIFWVIPFSEVVESLRRLKLGYFAAAFALILVSAYVQSLQLWLLLRRLGMPTSVQDVFEATMVTRFYGQFLPSELMAGAVKLYRLAGPGKQWGEVVAAQTCSRLITTLVLVLMGFAFWAVEMPTGPGRWAGALMAAMAVALLALHAFLASNALGHFAVRALPARAREVLRTTSKSYRLFGNVATLVTITAVLRHLIDMTIFGLIALSVDVHLSYLTIGWIRVVLQAVMMLPIAVSGLGVREGSLVLLLQEYAVPPSQAVALSLVLLAGSVLSNGLGGVLELVNLHRPTRRDVAGSGTEEGIT